MEKNIGIGEFIDYLYSLGDVIYINNDITRCLGAANASAIYSFMAKMDENKGMDEDFSCTYKEIHLFTGIAEAKIAASIKLLIKNNLLTCKRKGLPAKIYYSFTNENIENLDKLLNDSNDNSPIYKNSLMRQNTYVIKDLDREGVYKIGKSRNPKSRIKQLMYEFPNLELIMVCDSDIESDLHNCFKNSNVKGEWFNLSNIDLDMLVNNYNFKHVINK